MNPLNKEWQILKQSILFFTRIPLPQKTYYSEHDTKHAIRYLPLIGVMVGLCASIIFILINTYFSLEISVFLSMISTIILTGAIHEDGFADFCDSLGGMTSEKRLLIMKDSNMGAFGVIGLWGMLFGKYLFLNHIPVSYLPCVYISGHIMSRFFILFLILFLPYAGNTETSKSISLVQTIHIKNIGIAAIITGFILLALPAYVFVSIPALIIIMFILFYYYKKSIGGYTGDYLGAAQQLTEIAHYLSFVFWLNIHESVLLA
jgi:adenosylcobinamide-GDP ribazoletransferase